MEVETEEAKSDTAPVNINIAGFSSIDEFTKVCQCQYKRRQDLSFNNIYFYRLVMLLLLKDLNAQMHFLLVPPEVYMRPVLHSVK